MHGSKEERRVSQHENTGQKKEIFTTATTTKWVLDFTNRHLLPLQSWERNYYEEALVIGVHAYDCKGLMISHGL